ncbi:MAG: hypothetical protein K6T65_11330 [Peptococcaceae bacterium]|nr:hypothetical protein [Peptococcaceae bacterium]
MKSKLYTCILILVFCSVICYGGPAFAGSYSYYLGELPRQVGNYATYSYSASSINLIGYNATHGISKAVPASVSLSASENKYRVYLNYTLPDDGSTWNVQGFVSLYITCNIVTYDGSATSYGTVSYNIDLTNTTSGTFSGYSPKTATDAANATASSASLAATNAMNAYNEAHTANIKLDKLQTSIMNIQNNMGADVAPPVVRIRTVSGAMATSGSSIQAVVDVADNVSSVFTYSLDGSNFTALPGNKVINLPVNSQGINLITVWIMDEAGNVCSATITIRKL